MKTIQIKKLERTYPANTTVLDLQNHQGQSGHECNVPFCRDVWFYGDGDVRNFDPLGTVCATHGYLIPRMSFEEMDDRLIADFNGNRQSHMPRKIYADHRYEVDMFYTVVYTPDGKKKEFISKEGQKRNDELEEFLRSRRK